MSTKRIVLPPVDYLLVGHITADLTPNGRSLGGTPAYAAATASAFGLRVGVVTSAANDEPLLDEIAQWAVVHSVPAAATTTFENRYLPGGREQLIRGVAANLTADLMPGPWRATPAVHIAPMAGEVAYDVPALFAGSRVLLTLQGWLRQWDETGHVRFRHWHDEAVLRHVSTVVFSEEDIRPAPELEAALARDCETLVVTRAERGGTVYERGQPAQYDAFPASIIEPTGAGDVFAAALLASMVHAGLEMRQAVQVAAQLAATAVTRPGLQAAPTPDEVKAALASVR